MSQRRQTPTLLGNLIRRVAATLGVTLAAMASLLDMSPHVVDAQQPVMAPGLESLHLRPGFAVVAGAGANIGIQMGPDGTVVVDAGLADRAGGLVAELKRLTPQPIRYVIDTNANPDHVGGNEIVAKAGRTLFNLNPLGQGLTNGGAAAILAAEGVLRRMSASSGPSAYPTASWPTEAFEGPRKYMFLNGEGIEVLHQPAAHSDADVIVYFRRSDVVMAGDILDTTRFPVIDVANGGSIQGEIDALNRLVTLAIPSVPIVSSNDAGTYVVPGHGYVMDQLDVVDYRDMVTIIRDRIRDLAQRGMTLDAIVAANPTAGYTGRYGTDSGEWTTRRFIEAVYQGVTRERRP